MRLPRPANARQRDNTIALINIVFLMLILFLAAGTLTAPFARAPQRIEMADAELPLPDMLVVSAQGELEYHGRRTSAAGHVVSLRQEESTAAPAVEIAADSDLPAAKLIKIVGDLRAAGAGSVSVVTQREPR